MDKLQTIISARQPLTLAGVPHGFLPWLAADLARAAARVARVDASGVVARSTKEMGLIARRPAYSVLGSERGLLLPPLEDALSRYFANRAIARAAKTA